MAIRIGIVGWGNLGRSVLQAAAEAPDLTPVCVLTRRDPAAVAPPDSPVPFARAEEAERFAECVDVMALCGSSAYDLPRQTPQFARDWCVVDSFDTHRTIDAHFQAVDLAARQGQTLAVISAGWDPGLFSLWRLLAKAAIPDGAQNTFWGRGVSQGHSEAIRHIAGVRRAVQYTVPKESALEQVRRGDAVALPDEARIRRVCYVVAEAGADKDAISREIAAMPHYFAPYETAVFFISEEEFLTHHTSLSHEGRVYSSDSAGERIACSLFAPSNPTLTAHLLLSAARAAHRLHEAGEIGCRTFFDVPPALLLPEDGATLRTTLL
jgi:diaminopimelate dehydrogenase